MTPQRIDIPTDAGPMPAWRFAPDAGGGPGLVLFQEIFGVTDYIRARAADLADLGYVVLVPEVYWRLGAVTIDEGSPDFLQQAMAAAGRLDWRQAVADGLSALDALRLDPQVVGTPGVVGFCFGGGLAFDVAATGDPAVLVSYYGSAIPGLLDRSDRVTMPSLHHFGLSDAYIPADLVERIRAAVARDGVRFETYPGAGHAFDNPHPMFHDAAASEQAWRRTADFLAEALPPEPA